MSHVAVGYHLIFQNKLKVFFIYLLFINFYYYLNVTFKNISL